MLRIYRAALAGDCEEITAIHAFDPALLDYPDRRGNTAMHIAAENGHTDLIKLLFELKSKAYRIYNQLGNYPVHSALITAQYDAMKMICRLDRNSLSLMCGSGYSILAIASDMKQPHAVAIMHGLGAEDHFQRYGAGGIITYDGIRYDHTVDMSYARGLYFSRSLVEILYFSIARCSPQSK